MSTVGEADKLSNMQWQPIREAKEKGPAESLEVKKLVLFLQVKVTLWDQ